MSVRRYTENIPAYPVEINYMKEKNSFVARIPDLKYCRATGKTPELALEELQLFIRYTIKKAEESGTELPKPSKFID